MKADELMFGDWVYYSNNPQRIKGAMDFTIAKDFYPITLTPEILEKNGFKFEHNGLCTWCDGINNPYQVYVSLWFRMDCSVRIVDVHNHRDKFFTDNIPYGYYVHELQHALRLCGLKRLADNFIV